jgi:hypothetical protein
MELREQIARLVLPTGQPIQLQFPADPPAHLALINFF